MDSEIFLTLEFNFLESFLVMKYERYTESNAKPQGLNTATRPALKAIPDLSNVDRFEKKVLVLAEISKPKNNIFEIFSLSRKKPNKTKNIRYKENKNI